MNLGSLVNIILVTISYITNECPTKWPYHENLWVFEVSWNLNTCFGSLVANPKISFLPNLMTVVASPTSCNTNCQQRKSRNFRDLSTPPPRDEAQRCCRVRCGGVVDIQCLSFPYRSSSGGRSNVGRRRGHHLAPRRGIWRRRYSGLSPEWYRRP